MNNNQKKQVKLMDEDESASQPKTKYGVQPNIHLRMTNLPQNHNPKKFNASSKNVPRTAPKSPTDDIMSPVTRQLMDGRHKNPAIKLPLNRFIPSDHIFPTTSPCTDETLILGSSSKSRKFVIDLLNWKHIQMSPDIDGFHLIRSTSHKLF
jgi:hypothetical protein